MEPPSHCYFASDLHGHTDRYEKLFRAISEGTPGTVLLGGDLLPLHSEHRDFFRDFLMPGFQDLKQATGSAYPQVLLILGNDDPRSYEDEVREGEAAGLWTYLHFTMIQAGKFQFYGYSFVPPTPFRLKDWEKYDVSRFVDPGCVDPHEGVRSVPVPDSEIRFSTIQKDLDSLFGTGDLSQAIILFHTPPYRTQLDRAALDGKMVDSAPLDVHVGSIAVRRFIEKRQPRITLHGHIHESARLMGTWKDRIENTWMFSAAHDGPELALVCFQPEAPETATRELL